MCWTRSDPGNTPYTNKVLRDHLLPERNKLFKIFHRPHMRPFDWDECKPDLAGVIRKIASQYTDTRRVTMHTEELEAEGWYKIAKLWDKQKFKDIPNRSEFFKLATTCVKNHIIGLVNAQVYTAKRTGVKLSEREEGVSYAVPTVSLDSELEGDTNSSYAATLADEKASDVMDNEILMQDVRALLTPAEKMVLDQLFQPNSETFVYATVSSNLNRKQNSPYHLRIKAEDYANGLGIPVELFSQIHESIKTKVKRYMADHESDILGAEIRQLEDVFEVKVPPTLPIHIIRRLFTISARDQHTKVTPEVVDLLRKIGAKAPTPIAPGTLSCFGILYQEGNRICSACGLRASCAVEARNVGLGEITLSPKLLGQKLTRIPAMIAGKRHAEPAFSSPEDEEVWNYLLEILERDDDDVLTALSLKETGVNVFQVETPFRVRVIRPDSTLYPLLEKVGKVYYLPDGLNADETIRIIDLHLDKSHATAAH